MKRGFTLLEVLLVLAIIGIIAGIAIPGLVNMSARNNNTKVKADIRSLQVALESYYLHNSSAYPSALSDITAAAPVIVKTLPKDPYSPSQAVYGYNRSPNAKYYVIFSAGPSGNGSASCNDSGVLTETNGASCIYVSNIQEDITP